MLRIWIIVGLGLTLLALLTFQVLVGRRTIDFHGALQFRVHKWTGYTLLGVAFTHAVIAIGWIFGWY